MNDAMSDRDALLVAAAVCWLVRSTVPPTTMKFNEYDSAMMAMKSYDFPAKDAHHAIGDIEERAHRMAKDND